MIDYEKLKIAHELADKSSDYFFKLSFGVDDYGSDGTYWYEIELFCAHGEVECTGLFNDIDDLITKLRELTAPKPKYKVGDSIWVNEQNEALETVIVDRDNFNYELDLVTCDSCYRHESELYPSRESLIQAQIEHWSSMLPETVTVRGVERELSEFDAPECEHESDGYCYDKDGSSVIGYRLQDYYQQKCNKCGEFYR